MSDLKQYLVKKEEAWILDQKLLNFIGGLLEHRSLEPMIRVKVSPGPGPLPGLTASHLAFFLFHSSNLPVSVLLFLIILLSLLILLIALLLKLFLVITLNFFY